MSSGVLCRWCRDVQPCCKAGCNSALTVRHAPPDMQQKPFTNSSISSRDTPLTEHSRFFQRLHRRYEPEMALLPPGVPTRDTMNQTCDALLARGHDLGAALRILRQLVMERLIHLDCECQVPLEDICLPVTHLAEMALDRACIARDPCAGGSCAHAGGKGGRCAGLCRCADA